MESLRWCQKVLKTLRNDEVGATLTTELLMLSTLTIAGILTVADDVRTGVDARVSQFVQTISAPIEFESPNSDSLNPDHEKYSPQCVTVLELD